MKLVTCVVRPERLHEVKEALFQVGVTGMTLSRVSGHGGEQEIVEHYRGSALVLEFRDKVKIEMAVSEPFLDATIQAIVRAARTGEVGDGKIFVQELERVVRIRTGERDVDALTPENADEVQAAHSDPTNVSNLATVLRASRTVLKHTLEAMGPTS